MYVAVRFAKRGCKTKNRSLDRLGIPLVLDCVAYFETVSIEWCPHGDMICRRSDCIIFFFIEVHFDHGGEVFAVPVGGDLVQEAEEGLAGGGGVVGLVEGGEDAGGGGFGLGGGWDVDGLGLLGLQVGDAPQQFVLFGFEAG